MKIKKLLLFLILITTMTSCSEFPDLGGNYIFNHDENYYYLLSDTNNKTIIDVHITKYYVDSTYIIVSSYENKNIALKNSSFMLYWIINKSNDSIFGPFYKDKYIVKLKEISLPLNISFLIFFSVFAD